MQIMVFFDKKLAPALALYKPLFWWRVVPDRVLVLRGVDD